MAKEFRILHHRQAGTGGHWDLVENPIAPRAAAGAVPHGEGSLCGALQSLTEEGWTLVMDLASAHHQVGETFILLSRG